MLRYTLVPDGSSDAVLKPIIEWLIAQHRPDLGVLGECAHQIGTVGRTLEDRIPAAIKLFPCDLLIVHRDAELVSWQNRIAEIGLAMNNFAHTWVPIVPVRMTEAWLFSDEAAIRSAAENKNGTMPLNLPPRRRWELLPDPKDVLFRALETASGKGNRALKRFNPARGRALVAQRTVDFGGLRGIPSFDAFEQNLINALQQF